MLDTKARKYFQPCFSLLGTVLAKTGLSPNHITAAAFIIGMVGAAALWQGYALTALLLLWLSGLADVLDGTVARLTGKNTSFGAFLDLIFDRTVEMGYISVIAWNMPEARMSAVFLLCSIIYSFSIFLASGALIAKKTEKAFYYQAGLAERTETFIVFSLIILLPAHTVDLLNVFTAMIVFTGFQRLLEVYRYLKDIEEDKQCERS